MMKLLDRLLDGELDPPAAREAQIHLDECSKCSSYHEGEKELRRLIKGTKVGAPAHLRSRIQEQVGGRGRPFRWVPIPLAAAACLTVAILFFLLPQQQTLEAVVARTVDCHEQPCPPDCLCNEGCPCTRDNILKYFRERVDYEPRVADFSDEGFAMEMAFCRKDIISGSIVCWMTHRNAKTNETITHVTFPADYVHSMEGGTKIGDVYLFKVGDHIEVVCLTPGMLCIFIADGPMNERLLETIQKKLRAAKKKS
jgi:hypothetical protein